MSWKNFPSDGDLLSRNVKDADDRCLTKRETKKYKNLKKEK